MSEIRNSKKEISELQKRYDEMKTNIKAYEKMEEDLSDKIDDIENRSMRENLISYRIPEGPSTHESNETRPENCELLVKELMKGVLDTGSATMIIDRAHRLGGPRARKPRPIVVKFHKYSDRELVRKSPWRKIQKNSYKIQIVELVSNPLDNIEKQENRSVTMPQ